MKRPLLPVYVLAVISLIAAPMTVGIAMATDETVQRAPLHDFDSSDPPRHGWATLYRNDDGIAVTVDTRHLTGNSPHTFWIVIFNDPGACTDPCGLDDLGLDSASIVFGGAAVTTASGKLHVSSGLNADFAPPGPPGRCCFGPGVTDTHGSEIHIIVQDHFAVDLATIHLALQVPGGGLGGVDVQSAVFLPVI